MGKKYFSWNFDDGLEEDKTIINILKSYGMGATFNLNSNLFGNHQMIGRIGNLGFKEISISEYERKRHRILKYGIHYRIPEDEIQQVYEGFEVASHTADHTDMTKLSGQEMRRQIETDQKFLSEKFHQEITGFAYPFGRHNVKTKEMLKDCGITYARTGGSAKNFSFPADLLELPMTGWHIRRDAITKVQQFIDSEIEEEQFFLMFAHGYELDFGTKESNYDKFKKICDMVSGRDDIICCSTGEAIRRHNSMIVLE